MTGVEAALADPRGGGRSPSPLRSPKKGKEGRGRKRKEEKKEKRKKEERKGKKKESKEKSPNLTIGIVECTTLFL